MPSTCWRRSRPPRLRFHSTPHLPTSTIASAALQVHGLRRLGGSGGLSRRSLRGRGLSFRQFFCRPSDITCRVCRRSFVTSGSIGGSLIPYCELVNTTHLVQSLIGQVCSVIS